MSPLDLNVPVTDSILSDKINHNILVASEEADSVSSSSSNGISHLSEIPLDQLPQGVFPPAYNRSLVTGGILHIGTGNFMLAHLGSIVHDTLDHDQSWGIIATSIRSEKTLNSLRKQDNLYALAVRQNTNCHTAILAPVVDTIYGPNNSEKIFESIASDPVRLITVTVTNKGYYLSAGGKLDTRNKDIVNDIKNPAKPKTVYGYIYEGIRRRHANKGKPITIMSLDNIEENSSTFRKAFMQYLERVNPQMMQWAKDNVDFLTTLVDRITPEPTEAFRDDIHQLMEVETSLTIGCEKYRQLVVEKGRFEMPPWHKCGVQVVDSCASYWQRKFYCLNAGHMIVAACGNRLGCGYIHETMSRKAVNDLLALAQAEWCSILSGDQEELKKYTAVIRQRFADESINDTVKRVGARATSKVSDRLLSAVELGIKNNNEVMKAPIFAMAIYLLNLTKMNENNQVIECEDSEAFKLDEVVAGLTARLRQLPAQTERLSSAAVQDILEQMTDALMEQRFLRLASNENFVAQLGWSLVQIHRHGLEAAATALVAGKSNTIKKVNVTAIPAPSPSSQRMGAVDISTFQKYNRSGDYSVSQVASSYRQ